MIRVHTSQVVEDRDSNGEEAWAWQESGCQADLQMKDLADLIM